MWVVEGGCVVVVGVGWRDWGGNGVFGSYMMSWPSAAEVDDMILMALA